MNMPPSPLGEIIATQASHFTAQSVPPTQVTWPTVLPLGSWVQTQPDVKQEEITYGVVSQGGLVLPDRFYQVQALGLSRADLQAQHPQLVAQIRSELTVAVVAGQPLLHQAIWPCPAVTIVKMSQTPTLWRSLGRSPGGPSDQLLAAVLVQTYRAWVTVLPPDQAHQWLVSAGRTLARHLGHHYESLRTILQSVQIALTEAADGSGTD